MKKSDFNGSKIKIAILRERAYNNRWAENSPGVIPLTAADPDFEISNEIKQAIIEYTKGGVFSYGPAGGLPEFKEACVDWIKKRKNISADKEQIVAVDSAAAGLAQVANLIIKPGDEAIIFDPVDFLFKSSIEGAGGKVRLLPIDPETKKWSIDSLKSLISKKTKLICVCNPHNPLGHIFSREELSIIGELAVKHKIMIINDEIWSDIVYSPNKFISLPSVSKDIAKMCFTIHGFSKNFALAGLRIGYVICPDELWAKRLIESSLADKTISGVSTLSQIAAIAAYKKATNWLSSFLRHLKKQRNYAYKFLSQIDGVTVSLPESTYILFIKLDKSKFPEIYQDPILFVNKIRDQAGVAVVPGAERWFGPGSIGHIRIVYSTSHEILKEGLKRLKLFLEKTKINQ